MVVPNYGGAVNDFWQARRKAGLESLMSRLTGKDDKDLELLSYEDVRQKLHAKSMTERGLHEIPLSAIVGSVNRYRDFTRTFLPLQDSDSERWARVKMAQTSQGTPPIEVYKIGDAYFVLDGNHRVSIARQLGTPTIEAYVTEVETKVPLSADDTPDDLILKAEYADFLEQTNLDTLVPNANLILTAPGKYPQLLEHIEVHRYYMGLERKRDISYTEATVDWYQHAYRPIVKLIHNKGLLHSFPNRTEADMYLWLMQHRASVEEYLGWKVQPEQAALDLVEQFDTVEPGFKLSSILRAVTPGVSTPSRKDTLRRDWRRDRLLAVRDGRLASVILLPIRYQDVDWRALDQATVLAQREDSIIRGLYAVPTTAERDSLTVQALRDSFKYRCDTAGVNGELIVEVGDLDEVTYDRARWVDLTILRVPGAQIHSGSLGLTSYRKLLKKMPSPVLIVSAEVSPLNSALLAYDGSEETDAALFAAAHLSNHWNIPLTVVSTAQTETDHNLALTRAGDYLKRHNIEATLIHGGDLAYETILAQAEAVAASLIIMGDIDFATVAKAASMPVLVCR